MDVELAFKHIENEDRRNKHLERKIRCLSPERNAQEVNAALGLLMLRYQPSRVNLITPVERITTNGTVERKISNGIPTKKHGTFFITEKDSNCTKTNYKLNGNGQAAIKNDFESKFPPSTIVTLLENKRRPTRVRSPSLLAACRDILKEFLDTEEWTKKH